MDSHEPIHSDSHSIKKKQQIKMETILTLTLLTLNALISLFLSFWKLNCSFVVPMELFMEDLFFFGKFHKPFADQKLLFINFTHS